ncbi:AAA family ATPase [Streptosporangium sp. NPDC006013]|uniref:AAA family ATPase n=1 Tax=Streptosporangium sp. NPDC006013 TaxID=3155596 RepID=UPI0033B04AF9
MIIAIEGVSSTGKSTLVASLAHQLGWDTVSCYYHVADDPAVLGEPLATSEDEQLAAVTAHLAIEEQRHRQAQAALARHGGVILDRSVDTVLAHMGAVDRIQGLDARARALALVTERVAADAATVPDLTLLLTAAPEVLGSRAARRPGLPRLYYDPAFVTHFNAHFAAPLSLRCVRLDAEAAPEAVLDAALNQITHVDVISAGRT